MYGSAPARVLCSLKLEWSLEREGGQFSVTGALSQSSLFLTTNLELMPKAVMKASFIPYMNLKGLVLRTTKKMRGKMMKAWIIKPTITVTMNKASLLISPPMSSMLATRCAMRLHTPNGAYLTKKRRIRWLMWDKWSFLISSKNVT